MLDFLRKSGAGRSAVEQAQPKKSNADTLTKVLIGVAGALFFVVIALLFFVVGRETAPATERAVSPSTSGGAAEYDFGVLNDILSILERDYVKPDNIDDQTLYEAAINGLLNSLNDSGTYYVDPETYKVSVLPSGTFEGIGATISQQGNEIVVVTPIKDTPAEAAGIQPGDVILAVEGESTEGWSTEKTVLKIRGPKGTDVTITIRKADTGREVELTITRAPINVASVSTLPPAQGFKNSGGQEVGGIGYIRISEFTARTPGELEEAIREEQGKGAKGLIIDVRGNPGGLLSSVERVSDMFLDRGTIIIQRNKNGREDASDARNGQSTNVPIVVLQNKFSASAAEVFAAALQENGRATVVGETSFGKATVNIARELDDGGAVFVSIAQWLTPNGQLIDQVGIRPDIEVIPTDEDIDLRRDPQMSRAVDVLEGQVRASATP
jgi:carboxyl-terminal processing protease